ncbi:MAG TPA: S9 family peptidase [Thermoanaerobaculia bacterium]|nr:S9 family peptidase [Thermoanaerobaculia bacterium]
MSRRAAWWLGLLAAASVAPAAWAAPPPLDQVLAGSAALETFREVAISPDGRRVAWVQSLLDKSGRPTELSALYVSSLGHAPGAPPATRRITVASWATPGKEAVERAPAWSPDSHSLAFLSDMEVRGQRQLYVAPAGEGETGRPRRLTRLEGQLADPRWAPDGRSIAFLYLANRRAAAGPLAATRRDAGVVGETPEEQRLVTVDVATGALRLVSPADLYVYEYDWSPDGKSFAATAAHGSGDDNWYEAELYVLRGDAADAAQGTAARSIYKPRLQIASPRWSPDGATIAWIGGLMSDEGANGGDVYVLPASPAPGTEARDLTPGRAASPAWLAWTAADRILFVENVDGLTAISEAGLADGKVTTLWSGAEVLSAEGSIPGLSLARDGRTSALLRQSSEHPPEVWVGPLGDWRQLTRENSRFAPSWGPAKSVHWKSDGASVQGWLLYPPGPLGPLGPLAPGARLPMVVSVHGGPAGCHRPGWPSIAGVLASQGFLVFQPNPRGSFGQGEAFTQANVKDFGYGDLRDILTGVDEVVRSGEADGARTGISGWSYGGYMAMWAVTQTDRFRAAVAGAGVANWQSYYGENRIDRWMIPYFGASVYDDPFIYARSSPITYITRVKTPTLVLQGDRDAEMPAPQAYEFWHALKTLEVETQLVIYPDEGHHFLDPEHDRDRYRRIVAWFQDHLK